MVKYTAKDIITYATRLADLQNSAFITWGDNFSMLNTAWRKVYQNLIDQGELSYLKEVRLLCSGTSVFDLPDDFYQLAMLCTDWGNEIPRARLANNKTDCSYELKNDTITLYNCRGNVVFKYYPKPETLSYRQEETEEINISGTVLTGWGTNVVLDGGTIYSVSQHEVLYTVTSLGGSLVLGKDAVLRLDNKTVHYLGSPSVVDTLISPLLTSDGSFVEDEYESCDYGWCNEDCTSRYTVDEGNLYYNGELIIEGFTDWKSQCFYWDGEWCLITNKYIIHPDGSYETTDVKQAVCILKQDMDTGYGYLIRTGSNKYKVTGFAPNTTVDYPNNVLFELVAYELAILYRVKQNSDASALGQAYQDKASQYFASISNDELNYVTIRNVDGRSSHYRGVW